MKLGSGLEHALAVLLDALGSDALGLEYYRALQEILDCEASPTSHGHSFGDLPIMVSVALQGDKQKAIPVSNAWRLLLIAAKLLDDVEDREETDQSSVTINTATSLIFAAQLVLSHLTGQGDCTLAWQIGQSLQRAMLRASAGQHSDLRTSLSTIPFLEPDEWEQVAFAKSGEPFGWACWAGAMVGGGHENEVKSYRDFGRHLGVLLQVTDDFNGVWRSIGPSDLATAHLTLPICYALTVTSGDRRRALEVALMQARQDRAAEMEARQMLVDLGAQAFLLVVAQEHYSGALVALEHACPDSEARAPLFHLLNNVFPIASKPK